MLSTATTPSSNTRHDDDLRLPTNASLLSILLLTSNGSSSNNTFQISVVRDGDEIIEGDDHQLVTSTTTTGANSSTIQKSSPPPSSSSTVPQQPHSYSITASRRIIVQQFTKQQKHFTSTLCQEDDLKTTKTTTPSNNRRATAVTPTLSMQSSICVLLLLLLLVLLSSTTTNNNSGGFVNAQSSSTIMIGNEKVDRYWNFNTTETDDYDFTDLMDIHVNRLQVKDFLTSYMYPVHQPYMPHPITFDSKLVDLCDDFQVETDNSNKPLNVSFSTMDCIEYFCGTSSNQNFTLSTKLERFTFSRMINHCLFCMSDKAQQFRAFITNENTTISTPVSFRETIQSDNCPQFPEYYSIKSRLIRHCNSEHSISNNLTNSLAVGIVNEYYFDYSSYYGQRIKDRIKQLGRKLSAFEILNMTTLQEQERLYNPIICYCYQGNYYGFQCDAYSSFFSPLCNNWLPPLFVIIYTPLTILIVLTLCVPQLDQKIRVIKKRVSTMEGKVKRARSIVAGLFNIKLQGIYFLVGASVFILIENLHDILSNFAFYRPFHQNFINGVFRAISVACLGCCFVSMVVNWSHVVNATMAHKPQAKSRLGTGHKIILSVFYGILLVCILVMIIVYAATLVNVYAFIVLGISGILYSLFVLFGFLFYGLKIFFSLRKTQDVAFSSLRITKFMLAIDFYFVIVMIVAAWVVLGYITGWDNVGLFLGEYRNVELDLVFLVLILLLTYMLYHSEHFSQTYCGYTVGSLVKKISCCLCELRDDKWEDQRNKQPTTSNSAVAAAAVAEKV